MGRHCKLKNSFLFGFYPRLYIFLMAKLGINYKHLFVRY